MKCLHPGLPDSTNIYIDPRRHGVHCMSFSHALLLPDQSSRLSITYIDLHWVCHRNLQSSGGSRRDTSALFSPMHFDNPESRMKPTPNALRLAKNENE